ncbi:MAG: FHA domain-containing protein [Deltaproteobacteria bacterium]|nr:FHA domain-containing protein [Deltaproteobacteria bacterium]
MIFNFFRDLVRSKITGQQISAKGKVSSLQARARSKAAGKFNKAIDGTVKGVKGAAGKKAEKKEGGKMGIFFWKKKKENQPARAAQDAAVQDESEKTQAINIESFADDRSKDVVGWIVAMDGALKGKDFRLVSGKNTIGTSADSDIVITDQYISSHHAIIRFDDNQFMLQDLDSTNGTFINGKKIVRAELIDNDTIKMGRTKFRFKSLY